MGLGGCGMNEPGVPVYGPPEGPVIEDDTDDPMNEVYGPPEAYEIEDEESADTGEEHYIGTFYSDDGTVSIVQDFDAGTAVIVDGDEEIPVEISDGVYGPRIMKCDIDGDGEDEYVISECEGTGTGFSTHGLCIVEKTDSDYKLTRYDWNYFAEIINSRFSYSYDPDENKLRFYIENSDKNLEFFVAFEGDDKLEEVVFTDIVDVYFADGKVYLSAALGLIFEGHGYPDYEQGIEPYAPITIDIDSGISVGDFTVLN